MPDDSSPPLPKDAKELDFDIERERWSLYDVDNGITLRARSVLIKLFKLKAEAGKPGAFSASTAVLIDIKAPAARRKTPPPERPATPDEIASADKEEVAFSHADEPWNEYTFDEGAKSFAIRTRLVVSGVQRAIGVYDQLGNPVFVVSHSTLVAPAMERKARAGR